MIIPARFLDHNKNVNMAADTMFVNKINFLNTIYRYIQFGTEEMITDANTITPIQSVVNVRRVYKKRGFCISTLHVDGKFGTSRIRGAVEELNVTLDPKSEDENVPEAEIYIRNIKKSNRCVQTTLKFNKIPGRITIGS